MNSLLWLLEPLEDEATYLRRKMFGCEAAYCHGKLMLVLADGEEPWNGIMVAMAREDHAALQAAFPMLVSHKILGKWLYLSQADPQFETIAPKLVALVKRGDLRIGVEPKVRAKKRPKPGKKKLK